MTVIDEKGREFSSSAAVRFHCGNLDPSAALSLSLIAQRDRYLETIPPSPFLPPRPRSRPEGRKEE